MRVGKDATEADPEAVPDQAIDPEPVPFTAIEPVVEPQLLGFVIVPIEILGAGFTVTVAAALAAL